MTTRADRAGSGAAGLSVLRGTALPDGHSLDVVIRDQIQHIIDEAGLDEDGRACLDEIVSRTADTVWRHPPGSHIDIDLGQEIEELDAEMRRRVLFALEEIWHVLGARLV